MPNAPAAPLPHEAAEARQRAKRPKPIRCWFKAKKPISPPSAPGSLELQAAEAVQARKLL